MWISKILVRELVKFFAMRKHSPAWRRYSSTAMSLPPTLEHDLGRVNVPTKIACRKPSGWPPKRKGRLISSDPFPSHSRPANKHAARSSSRALRQDQGDRL